MRRMTERIVALGSLVAGALMLGPAVTLAASLTAGTATGLPNTTATFSVSLNAEGATATGAQADIAFDPTNAPILPTTTNTGICSVTTSHTCTTAADCPAVTKGTCSTTTTQACGVCPVGESCTCPGGETCVTPPEPCMNVNGPDCTANSAIGKAAFFSFLPNGCSGTACTGVRGVVVSLSDTNAIPDGSVLFTCKVSISPSAPLSSEYPLSMSGAVVSNAAFQAICGTNPPPPAVKPPACGETDGKVVVAQPTETPYLVCDVMPSSGNDAGQFGGGSLNIADVKAIFKASLDATQRPPADSARFAAMDSAPSDSPPTCGGGGTLNIADVKACFKRSLQSTLPNYRRTGTGASCTSELK